MAVKPTETGGTFSAAAASAKRQELLANRAKEIAAPSQSIGTGYTNSAMTQEKVLVMAAKDPALGNYIGSLLLGTKQTTPTTSSGPTVAAASSISNVQTQPIDRYTKNVIQTIFSPEVATTTTQAIKSDSAESLSPSSAPSQATGEANHGVSGIKEDLAKILKPVSSFTGSTLGALPNLLNNPLGAPMALANTMTSLVDKVNPDFVNKIDAMVKQFKSSDLAHLPSQMMGSLRTLATAADKLLAMPANLLSDLYGGLMKIMQQISKLVDKVQTMIQNFFFGPQGILDQVLPMDLIKSVIDAVGEIGAMAGNISQLAGGFAAAQNLTSQLTNFTSQGMSFLNNPMSIADAYIPQFSSIKNALASGNISSLAQAAGGAFGGNMGGQIGQITSAISAAGSGGIGGLAQAASGMLGGNMGGQIGTALAAIRDPSQMLSKLVPQQLLSQMGNLAQVPGLGAVGNLGYGLGPILESLKGDVLSQVMSKFSEQAGIIASSLNIQGPPPIHDPLAENPVAIQTASTNPNVPVVQGVPIQTTPAAPIFEQNKNFQKALDANNAVNRLVGPDPGPFKLKQSNLGPTKEAAAAPRQAPLVMVPSGSLG